MTPSIRNQWFITATITFQKINTSTTNDLYRSLDPTNLGPKLRVKQPHPKQKTIPVKPRALGLKPPTKIQHPKEGIKNIFLPWKIQLFWRERFIYIYIFKGHLVNVYIDISTLRNLHNLHPAESAKVQTQIIRATDAAPDLLCNCISVNLFQSCKS